jgi:hypothetical protein
MRTLFLLPLLLVTVSTAFSQGTVNFRNDSFTLAPPPDRAIRFGPNAERLLGIPAGTPAYGTNLFVQLYYGASTATEESLIAVTNQPATLRSQTAGDGTWTRGGFRTLQNAPEGTTVQMQVRVWDSAFGSTYEQALLFPTNTGFRGKSDVFLYTVPHGELGPHPSTYTMTNFTGLIIDIPGPCGDCPPPQNLVSNGGFTLAGTTGWSGNSANFGYVGEPFSAQNTYGDWIGLGGTIYQDLNTVSGQVYVVSFAARGFEWQQSPRLSTLTVRWGDLVLANYIYPNTIFGWNYLRFIVTATNSVTRLRFDGAGFPFLDDVSVLAQVVPQTQITVVTPTNGAQFIAENNIPIQALPILGWTGTVTKVDFLYNGINLIGTATQPPYTALWTNVPAGTYYISAQVTTTNPILTTMSVGNSVRVNTRPTVRLINPVPEQVFTNGSNINVQTVVSNNNEGVITRLEIYSETNLLRAFSGIPASGVLSTTWSNVALGNFKLTALGKNAAGDGVYTNQLVIHVMRPSVPDQIQADSTAVVRVRTNTAIAQTFTAGANGLLHHVDLWMGPNAYFEEDPFYLEVFDAPGGLPGTNRLGGTLRLPYLVDGESTSLFFSSNTISLTAGKQYALVLTSDGRFYGYYVRSALSSPYAGGALWQRTPSNSWETIRYFDEGTPYPDSDLVFTTHIVPNQPPAVQLTSPTNGMQFAIGEHVQLSASASDSDGIQKVGFYRDGLLIGEASSFPYNLVWSNAPAGNYAITAQATDNFGAVTTSRPVCILVGPDNGLPRLTISDAAVAEGLSGFVETRFTVQLSAPSTNLVTVRYSTADGTAIAPIDYVSSLGTLSFPPGVTSVEVPISIRGDTINEPNETFLLNLFQPSNALLLTCQGLGTIVDDEWAAGKLHHFNLETFSNPTVAGRPVQTRIAAQDLSNSPVSDVVGPVCLSVGMSTANTNNMIIGTNLPTVSYNFFPLTLGYAFRPSVDILVTHFRYYSGTKISLWTDNGILLASESVTAQPPGWREKRLTSPVRLLAGQRYRLGFYSGGQPYYSRSDSANSFQHGSIEWGYFIGLDAFPYETDSSRWGMVDIRYTVETIFGNAVAPACVSQFTNGVLEGPLMLNAAGTIYLRAEDAFGHLGIGAPFRLNVPPSVALIRPENGDVFAFRDPILTEARVSPGNNPVLRVDFFAGTNRIGQVAQFPYSFTWTNAGIGDHLLKAVATDNLQITATSPPINISVLFMNRAPSFTRGADPTLLEDAGPQVFANWATSINPGVDESGQNVSFLVINNQPALFASPPAITPGGTLMFTPATNAHGVATVTVRLKDDGGSANGGVDTSPAQTFLITIQPVNDPPVTLPQTVLTDEDTAVPMNLVASDADGDSLAYLIITPPAHGIITGVPPALTYVPATNYFGPDNVEFRVSDGSIESALAAVTIDVKPVNDSPVADASATRTLVLSANNSNATVVLDGTRSFDVDDEALHYRWLPEGSTTPVATSVVALVVFPIGTNAVTLEVNDGEAVARHGVKVQVITSVQAVEQVVTALESEVSRSGPLIGSLSAAIASIDRSNPTAAINQLRAFQNQISAQVAPLDPFVAASLIQKAQEIIDLLVPSTEMFASNPKTEILFQAGQNSDRARVQFCTTSGKVHVIAASTNLVDWELIGVATETSAGAYEFEDRSAGHFPARFYRIISP